MRMKIILASKSPRRKELLGELGVKFDIVPAVSDEVIEEGLTPDKVVERIAVHKAEEVFNKFPDCAVIGADTIVVLDGEILQKPKDDEDEHRMLNALSGKKHCVYTGYALITANERVSGVDATDVYFNVLSDEVKQAYIESGLGLDKAGGYGIQDGYPLVEKIVGSYSNVVGFPQEVFKTLIKKFGL